MIRQGGYNCFSFRNIATVIGIKSSSVHYHFATKEGLIVAVTKHYTEKFLTALGEPSELIAEGIDPLNTYVSAFRDELVADQGMCLCGVLGAEANELSELILEEARTFFKLNIEWLERAYQLKGCTRMMCIKKHCKLCQALKALCWRSLDSITHY